jgi:hypothetical protein
MSNVSVITEAQYREDRRRFRGAYEIEWGGEPQVEFIEAHQLVDVLRSATGAVFQLSTRFPLWDTTDRSRVYVLRNEVV